MVAEKRIFEPVVVDSVSEAVVAQIEQLIISGVLKSGQQLPSERDLAELMDVSRPKVRDAIKVLEDRSLLTVKHGEGTFVASLTGTALSPAILDLFSRHPQAFQDYLEFRSELEGFASYLAADRATESDKDIIRQMIGRMEAAHTDPDPTEEARLDAHFHMSIVDAAHNSMIVHVMASIYELMMRSVFYNRSVLYSRKGARDALLKQHKAIADAVLEGDRERASAAAEAHMQYVQTAFSVEHTSDRRNRLARKRLMLMDMPMAGRGRRREA